MLIMMNVDVNSYKYRKAKSFINLTGCTVSLFTLIAFIFYMIYFFGIMFKYDVNWINTFFLWYGVIAFIIPLPMISKSIFLLASYSYKNKCNNIEFKK